MNDSTDHPATAARHGDTNRQQQQLGPGDLTANNAEDSCSSLSTPDAPEAAELKTTRGRHSGAMFGFRMLRYRTNHIKQHIQCEEAENRRIALATGVAPCGRPRQDQRSGDTVHGDDAGRVVFTSSTASVVGGDTCLQVNPEPLSTLSVNRCLRVDCQTTNISERAAGGGTTKCRPISMTTGSGRNRNSQPPASVAARKLGHAGRDRPQRRPYKLLLVIIYYLTILYCGSAVIGRQRNHPVVAVMATAALTTTAPLLGATPTLNRLGDSNNGTRSTGKL